MVVLNKNVYNNKVYEFIDENNIKKLRKDPTNKYVKELNNAINKCSNLFNETTKRYLKPINARAPQLTGLPKIHKENMPMRPVVNYTSAPGYRVSKKLEQIIKHGLKIRNNNSVKNSYEFIEKMKTVELSPNHKLVSFDVTNLYTNVPVDKTVTVLKNILSETGILNEIEVNELIYILQLVLKQNYFSFNDEHYVQEEGLAMGSPLSGLLADLYLNYFENEYLFSCNNKYKDKILSYSRYVDDTFLVFDGTYRQIEVLLNYMNSLDPKIKFTMELEVNNSLNFLDLTVTKENNRFTYKIYRKPTTTDTVIHADSHHPYEQKMAAFNAFVYRMLTVPLKPEDRLEEINTIKYIAIANGYNSSVVDKIIKRQSSRIRNYNGSKLVKVGRENNNKFIATEYNNVLPRIIKNELKKHNITVSFRTTNSIQKLLKQKVNIGNEKKTGVYKVICDDCNKFYVGQTGRPAIERFKEHLPKSDISKTRSSFAQHLMMSNHGYTGFQKNFVLLHNCRKGSYMNALEECEIYKASRLQGDQLLNDKLLFKSNHLYDTAINIDTKSGHMSLRRGDNESDS